MSLSTTRRTRRVRWTITEWTDFAHRAQDVRDRLDDLIRTFPETRGLTSRSINGFVKSFHRLNAALVHTESVLVRQHPGQDNNAIRFIHDKSSCFWGPCKGRSKKSAPILSRAEWVALGNRFKAIRADLMTLGRMIQETAPLAVSRRFWPVVEALAIPQAVLNNLASHQHPDWPQAAHAFSGKPLTEADTAASAPLSRAFEASV